MLQSTCTGIVQVIGLAKSITKILLQSTCTGIVQVYRYVIVEKLLLLQSTCTGIVQDRINYLWYLEELVAIYMHGYSAREFTSPLIISLSVAIYMHGYSASSGAEVLFVIWLVAIYTWFRG